MKKFLKSIGLCFGIIALNYIIIGLSSIICYGFIKDMDKINEYTYSVVLIGDLCTIILLNSIYNIYGKKLIKKEFLNKIRIKDIIYIILFGIGLSIILANLSGILTILIPSYIKTQNQLEYASNSIIQLVICIILVPICEEIIYRGAIFGYLREKYNIVGACIIQALFFGMAHGNIVQGIYTFILGIALALIYIYSNSLLGSIILHITFNLFGMLAIPKLMGINPSFIYILLILSIVCIVFSTLKILKKYEDFLYK